MSLLKTKTIQTELEYSGESLSYGFLVNEKDDYDFFVDFVQVGHGSKIIGTIDKGRGPEGRKPFFFEIQIWGASFSE